MKASLWGSRGIGAWLLHLLECGLGSLLPRFPHQYGGVSPSSSLVGLQGGWRPKVKPGESEQLALVEEDRSVCGGSGSGSPQCGCHRRSCLWCSGLVPQFPYWSVNDTLDGLVETVSVHAWGHGRRQKRPQGGLACSSSWVRADRRHAPASASFFRWGLKRGHHLPRCSVALTLACVCVSVCMVLSGPGRCVGTAVNLKLRL